MAGTNSLTSHSGGTAACVAAGRLARADPNLSILLVEGGPNNHNDPTITNPAMYLVHLLPTSKTTLFYEANAEEALNGRKAVVPCGGVLGGGSSINFMMYTRAQGCDFDDWDTKGWTAKDLLPLMKRVCNDRLHCYWEHTLTDTARELPPQRPRDRSISPRAQRTDQCFQRHILPGRPRRGCTEGIYCNRT